MRMRLCTWHDRLWMVGLLQVRLEGLWAGLV